MKLNQEHLKEFFAWVVDAQAFLPLNQGAKQIVDQLITAGQGVESPLAADWEEIAVELLFQAISQSPAKTLAAIAAMKNIQILEEYLKPTEPQIIEIVQDTIFQDLPAQDHVKTYVSEVDKLSDELE